MTLFIALVGAHPFDLDGANESDTSMVQSVLHGPDPFEDPRVQSVLSLAARDLLKQLLLLPVSSMKRTSRPHFFCG